MALPGKKAQLKFLLNGQAIEGPLEWPEIKVLATFDNEATQANITLDEFTFPVNSQDNNGGRQLLDWISAGLTGGPGIFEGPNFAIQTHNTTGSHNTFIGFVDLSDSFIHLQSEDLIKFKIKKKNGLNSLNDSLSALTYGYLESLGVFSDSDYFEIQYVAEKKINAFEILVANVILYLMIKEFIEQVKSIIEAVGNVAAHLAGGISGSIAAAVYSVVVAIVTIIYSIVMQAAILELGQNLIFTLVAPKRKAKTLKLKTALEKVAIYLGFSGFNTTVSDLDTVYYLPSNPNLDDEDSNGFVSLPTLAKGPQKGIPFADDYGYSVVEMFQLAADCFNGKYAIVDNVLQFHTEDAQYWIQQSLWEMPDLLPQPVQYNTNEFQANRIISFTTDSVMDEWTVDNFRGTNYEVITDAVNVQSIPNKSHRGLDQILLPVALGNRKDELNKLEIFLSKVAESIDKIANFFGGNSNLAGKIKGKVGLLKISTNNWTQPKLLKLNAAGKLSQDHRDQWSAKYLYDNYHISKSFVSNNYYGQKQVFTGIKVPFGFSDFLQLINNSYFHTFEGEIAKAIKIEWDIERDFAIMDFWIRKPYTINLKETTIEPE